MFADSLLDSHFTGRAQRGWTTLTSFALQTLALAGVLMLPLLYTEGLPKLHLLSVSAPIGRRCGRAISRSTAPRFLVRRPTSPSPA